LKKKVASAAFFVVKHLLSIFAVIACWQFDLFFQVREAIVSAPSPPAVDLR
jgi:hypothetical protein